MGGHKEEDKYQTLSQIIRAYHIDDGLKLESKNGSIIILIGATELDNAMDDRAYGYMLESSKGDKYDDEEAPDFKAQKMQTFLMDRVHWKIWKEPELVPHYPAIYRNCWGYGAEYTVSRTLYSNAEHAERCINHAADRQFIRLGTNHKPEMLPVTREHE